MPTRRRELHAVWRGGRIGRTGPRAAVPRSEPQFGSGLCGSLSLSLAPAAHASARVRRGRGPHCNHCASTCELNPHRASHETCRHLQETFGCATQSLSPRFVFAVQETALCRAWCVWLQGVSASQWFRIAQECRILVHPSFPAPFGPSFGPFLARLGAERRGQWRLRSL